MFWSLGKKSGKMSEILEKLKNFLRGKSGNPERDFASLCNIRSLSFYCMFTVTAIQILEFIRLC